LSPARVIAIDGPAGSGKSTVARRSAAALGFDYVDTGALYRSVALAAARQEIATDDAAGLGALAMGLSVRFETHADGQRVFIDSEDVTQAIRAPAISMAASAISAHAEVRAALLEAQRRLARAPAGAGAVLEGRDIGTVVCPDAGLKIFLTASVEERARRRHEELRERGQVVERGAVIAAIRSRDENDRGRAHAPLRQADDAVEVDSTSDQADAVVARVVALARTRFPQPG